ncbi:MAG: hypothetical protein ABFD97_21150 [Syntrophobacter sp.]
MAGEFELKKKALKRDADTSSEDKPDVSGGKPAKRPAGAPRSESDRPAGKSKVSAGASPGAESSGREPDQAENPPDVGAGKQKKGFLSRKTILYAVAALGVVVIASSIFFFLSSGAAKNHAETAPPPKLEPVTSITRPVPIPDYREMLDFLVLNETEGQKTLTLFRMEIAYHSPSRFKNFKEQNVIFRDTIYSFLLKQNSSRNTTRSWHNVVEKELLDYIRVKLPQSHADAIKLTQVENL